MTASERLAILEEVVRGVLDPDFDPDDFDLTPAERVVLGETMGWIERTEDEAA